MMPSPMDAALQATVLRFLEAMNRPLDAAVLGPALVRELYFRVLTGAQGNAMRAALAMRVEDVFVQNRRLWVRLHEKG